MVVWKSPFLCRARDYSYINTEYFLDLVVQGRVMPACVKSNATRSRKYNPYVWVEFVLEVSALSRPCVSAAVGVVGDSVSGSFSSRVAVA